MHKPKPNRPSAADVRVLRRFLETCQSLSEYGERHKKDAAALARILAWLEKK